MQQARRSPHLVVNASSLMLATVVTSVLGLVFWAVAARLYSADALGTGSALIAGASLLAGFSQLSLGMVFVRHLPAGGGRARWLIARSYALATGVGLLLATGYVTLGFGSGYLHGGTTIALFIVSVPVFTIFALQDPALLGLGAAPLVAAENAAFAAAKIALLPMLAGLTVVSGVFLSWALTAAGSVAVISAVVFGRLAPRSAGGLGGLPSNRALLSELALQHASSSTGYLTTFGLPLVVVERLGVQQAGYFIVPWMIGGTFLLLSSNVLAAMRVHAASGLPLARAEMNRILALLALINVAGAIACAVLAPWILDLSAPSYGQKGTLLLQLLCLAAPFMALWLLIGTFWWIEHRMATLIFSQLAFAVLMLGLSWYLTPRYGLAGVGWAQLVASVTLCLATARPLTQRVRRVYRG
jgi:O-antigen/teichoic acid export membrane protein